MGHISNRSLRSEFSRVIINFFDDFFQKTGSIKNSVTFKIPNKFSCRTENHFSNPSQSVICKNAYPKILEGLMLGIHASAEKRPVYMKKSCPVLLHRLHKLPGASQLFIHFLTKRGEPSTILVPKAS